MKDFLLFFYTWRLQQEKYHDLLGHCSEGFTYELHFFIVYLQLPSQLLKASQLILKKRIQSFL